jgi:hypothetical protein
MSVQTLSTEALTAIALRAALRAQPTFRLQVALLNSASTEDQRHILTALFMGAWSGFCVFWTTYDRNRMLSVLSETSSILATWNLRNRPEFAGVKAARAYLLRSPDFGPVLDSVIETSHMLAPEAFAAAAVREIQADVALLGENPNPAVVARVPLWRQPPEQWQRLCEDYANHLSEHGLSEYPSGYMELIGRVSRGEYDWDTPDSIFRRWLETPLPAEPQQQATADAPPAGHTHTPIDLTAYTFSLGAQQIVAGAVANLRARQREVLSSRAVVLEMAELGRPTADPQWIGDFVRQAVSPFPKPYAAALKDASFPEERRRVDPNDARLRDRMKHVQTMPGLAWSLDRARTLARETSKSDTIAGRHLFAALILDPPAPFELGSIKTLCDIGLDVPLLRQRLYAWVRGYGDDDVAWRRALTGSADLPRRRAGFDADGTSGVDLLNIDQDVLALATLIAARESSPPLSIGLFGDWGSGKTFFMNKLRRAVADLSAEARGLEVMQRDHWCYKRIVQIEFNAWHYVEGNLWASMVEHILSNLRFSEEPEPTVTETLQADLIEKLGFAKEAAAESEKKEQDAAKKVSAAETAVAAAKLAHDTRREELQALSVESINRDFDLGGVWDTVVAALEPLGIVPAGKAVSEMEESLRKARAVTARGAAGVAALVHAPDRVNRWRSLLIILIGAPVIGGLLTFLVTGMSNAEIGRVSGIVTGAAGLLTGAAQWIRKQAEWLSAQQDKVEAAQRKYDEALQAKLAEHSRKVIAKQNELALAQQDYLVAQQSAERARREREAASAELAVATTPLLLGRFIQDRAASSDYRKHLGVLAVVRQDFQRLSQLIEEDNWRLAPPNPDVDKRYEARKLVKVPDLDVERAEDARRINRIVLYIDDLDRCPPAKVVEVLQAVHLLLAFPLFVVVVGVDARWISRSLESRYRELLRVGDDSAGDIAEMFGVARSEDYLEKIFQIPLWLRRMDANDARRMVQGMLRASAPQKDVANPDPPAPKPIASPAAGAPPPAAAAPPPEAGSPPPRKPDTAPTATHADRRDDGHQGQSKAAATVNPESLTVRDFEVAVIDSLSPLLGRSPRALKRFVNLYRLIKAGLTPTEHDVFIKQSKDALDEYAAALFLLAVDTGLPRVSTAMFDVLLDVDRTGKSVTADEFLAKLTAHPAAANPEFGTLAAWIERSKGSRWFHGEALRQMARRVPDVLRHSFQAARIGDRPEGRRPARATASRRPAKRRPAREA